MRKHNRCKLSIKRQFEEGVAFYNAGTDEFNERVNWAIICDRP
jgi:hypothetical protein